jgi:hypothetical protein
MVLTSIVLGPRTKSPAFRGWPIPDTGPPPDYTVNVAGVATDTDWMFRHGTSFAAPFVSGCAAALRQTLINAGCATPKATLIKALLVNGATDLNGAGQIRAAPIIGPYPDPYQGFGRVNMQASLLNVTNTLKGRYHQNHPIMQGMVKRWDLYRPPGPFNLRATIVWAERVGAAGTTGPLQSVLVLRAILRPGGPAPPVTRYANTNGPAQDLVNNVQKLVWNNIPTGGVSLEVAALAIMPAGADQSFAIVWYVD